MQTDKISSRSHMLSTVIQLSWSAGHASKLQRPYSRPARKIQQ